MIDQDGEAAVQSPHFPTEEHSMSALDPTSTLEAPPASAEASRNRLRGGSLGLMDIASSTMANIGPAMSFFLGFGFLATTADVA